MKGSREGELTSGIASSNPSNPDPELKDINRSDSN